MKNKYHTHAGVTGSHKASAGHRDTATQKAHTKAVGGNKANDLVAGFVKKNPKTTKAVAQLSPEIKALNKKLGEANNNLKDLRANKKKGKDVRVEIAETLKFLKENREKKHELMEAS